MAPWSLGWDCEMSVSNKGIRRIAWLPVTSHNMPAAPGHNNFHSHGLLLFLCPSVSFPPSFLLSELISQTNHLPWSPFSSSAFRRKQAKTHTMSPKASRLLLCERLGSLLPGCLDWILDMRYLLFRAQKQDEYGASARLHISNALQNFHHKT